MSATKQQHFLSLLADKLKFLFSVDLRSLALFRVFLSLVIIYDLLVRSLTLVRDYTDLGTLPRAIVIEKVISAWRISFHLMSGLAGVQIFLFLVAALLAFMLLIGFKTRIATIFSWVMLMSLQARNPLVLQAGDSFFRMLLFFAMFLPLGAKFSVDALSEHQGDSATATKLPPYCFSFATVGLLLQVAFVYWFTAAMKLSDKSFIVWWEEATAVYYALSIDQLTLPLGSFILSLPFSFLKCLTRAVIVFEVIGPIFLFWPIFSGASRFIGVLGFVALQLGFGMCLKLGPFPFVATAAVLPFVPALFWDKFVSLECMAQKVKPIAVRFSKWTGPPLKNIAKPKIIQSASFSYIGLSLSINMILVFVIFYIFIWNMGTIDPQWKIKSPMNRIGVMLGFEQTWDMFSPPLTHDGWYVIPGKLKNGREVDLFRGDVSVSWEKPARVVRVYRSERERKYMMNIYVEKSKTYRLWYGKYLCRSWNRKHQNDERLQAFDIVYMQEKTLANRKQPQVRKKVIWSHQCFDTAIVEGSTGKRLGNQ